MSLVDPTTLLTLAAAARGSGGLYTESQLDGHVRRGNLEVVVIGNKRYVTPEAFERFVARNQFGGGER